ncbi:MAG: hypothetical protein AAF748_10545 [Pseudomonadota bacterium]
MIIIAAVALGAGLGYNAARRRGGNNKDRLQYAVGYALLFAVMGTFVTVIIDRAVL